MRLLWGFLAVLDSFGALTLPPSARAFFCLLEGVFAMFEPFDTFFDWRMSAEKIAQETFFKRIINEKRLGSRILMLHGSSMSVKLSERRNHTLRVAREMCGTRIGKILTFT